MLVRYLKNQLFVLLCGGLVGPIFLAVYFTIGQQDLLKWMFYVGLLVTAVDVLAALALTNYGAKSAAMTTALERDGVLGLAQITGISETGTRINEQPLVKLNLHISGPGITAFDSTDRVIASVSRLGNITARKLAVLVNPETQKYQIDWERSALVNGLVPAQFSLPEENRAVDLSGQAGPVMEILQILKANNIPLGQVVDVRSNPVVRQQVQAVLHRVAGARPVTGEESTTASGQDDAPEASIGQRLQDLEELRRSGVLTDEEYASKRTQIIAEI